VFAVNTHFRWSSAATNEFLISVDVDNDGIIDCAVFGITTARLVTSSGKLITQEGNAKHNNADTELSRQELGWPVL
jgi:hypothetical protein